jgi:hypothetical protein
MVSADVFDVALKTVVVKATVGSNPTPSARYGIPFGIPTSERMPKEEAPGLQTEGFALRACVATGGGET